MDMLDFDSDDLYFDQPLDPGAQRCLDTASALYGDQAAEHALLQAYFLEPEHPVVLVALYRYFYYQHRLEDALIVGERVIRLFARRLDLPEDWRELTEGRLGRGVMVSMTMIRFYLLALKGVSFLELRLGRYEPAIARLEKVAELDSNDRLGAAALLQVARDALHESGNALSA